jgi:hypothetical protein
MTRSRVHLRVLALCALIGLCLAAPARATLTLSNPTSLSDGSFYLSLSSDQAIEGVDTFIVTLTYSADDAATLTGAELGPGLPPFVAAPDPGWAIFVAGNTSVQAFYLVDFGEPPAVLPIGELVKLTFAAPTQAVTIQANLLPSSIDNGDLPALDSNVVAVPEPSSWLLLAGGLGALSLCARRRRR